MAQVYACQHSCGCDHTTPKQSDRNKHAKARTLHGLCTDDCPRYGSLARPTFQLLTPETYFDTLKLPTYLRSRKRRRSDSETHSIASTSTGERSREESVDDELEMLKREKEAHARVLSSLKICCVLDPSRTGKSCRPINGHSFWVDTTLPGGSDEDEQLPFHPGIERVRLPYHTSAHGEDV